MNRFLSLIMLLLLPAFALGQSTAILDGIGLANGKGYTNYIKNPNAQKNTVNVTASNLTVARSIITPLYSGSEFNLTSTSTPWSATWSALAFDAGMKNRLCEVQIMLRGTAAGTTTLEVLQNSVAVFTQTVTLDATNPKKYGGTFPCGDLTYASTVKLGGTGATTGAIEAGAVYLGEPVSVSSGGVVTEWQSFTPTFTTSLGLNTGAGYEAPSGWWRRVGDSIHILAEFRNSTAGDATGTGDFGIVLPNGLTAKFDRRYANGMSHIDHSSSNAKTPYNGRTVTVLGLSNVVFEPDSAGTRFQIASIDAGDYVVIDVTVPISGWSATDIVTPEASISGQIKYTTAVAQAITNSGSDVPIDFDTKVYDQNNEVVVGGSWAFTSKTSGNYQINSRVLLASASWAAGNVASIIVKQDGNAVCIFRKTIEANITQFLPLEVNCTAQANVGSVFKVYVNQNSSGSINLNNNSLYNSVSISKVTGPGSQSFYISSPLVAPPDGTGIKLKSSTNADIATWTDAGAGSFKNILDVGPFSLGASYAAKFSGSGSSAQMVYGRTGANQGWAYVGADATYAFRLYTGGTGSDTPSIGSGILNILHTGGIERAMTFSGDTASLGSAGSADIATTVSTGAYIVHIMGNGNSTQYSHAIVYSNNSGGITITTLAANGVSITSSGSNKITATNGSTAQTIKYTVLRIL